MECITMNTITRWFEHPLYHWLDDHTFSDMSAVLKGSCTEETVRPLLSDFPNVALRSVEFYPAGTYSEPEKTTLDNIGDFYLIRMDQKVAAKHTGTLRVYLPASWNGRFMGIAGAGTNNEVDWYTSVTFNVISWPMALKNGYACAVADNNTGIRLDCTWGFDDDGILECDQIEAWAFTTLHEMTVIGKLLTSTLYGQDIIASYMHGTSGGGRQVITEAAFFPEDYDGVWADGPAINYLDLQFACLWAPIVEANEKHVVPVSKYQAAFDLATADPAKKDLPFDSREIIWMDFIHSLLNLETPDGPITRRDLEVMVKTWDGPFTKDGKRMAYGFGPAIRQWPLATDNQMYGYLKRKDDGLLGLMPIAEQMLKWFTMNPHLDVRSLSYDDYEQIYTDFRKAFIRYDFNDSDFTAYAAHGGKLLITQGTGDCVVPFKAAIDYYRDMMDHFPSEKIMNQTIRMFMPSMAGHSILDWSGAAVSCAEGMKALTRWVEEGRAPDILPTTRYDFRNDRSVYDDTVPSFKHWNYQQTCRKAFIK